MAEAALELVAPVGSSDLAFIAGHPRALVRAQKPRLMQAKENHAKAGPVCTVAPAVTGTATVGQVQTSTNGTWLNSPTYTYQWRRRGVANITGATASTYTLAAGDSGYQVECEVTGTNAAGAATVKSNAVTVP